MTLKQFSTAYLPLPKSADFIYNNWRKVFPANLRTHNIQTRKATLFRNEQFIEVIEEEWERIHKGEVVATEWREIAYKDEDTNYER